MTTMRAEELRSRLRSALASGPRVEISLQGYQRAAVLVPVIADGENLDLLFTKRTETVETHKGQVSFPGGMVDADDEDILRTALREAREELGIAEQAVQVLGMLDDLATPTGFVITPVVGLLESLPVLSPNPGEVAEVFRLPLLYFADPAHARTEMREFRSRSHEVWYYDNEPHTIWGVTAVIIRSLLGKLRLL